MDSSSDRGTRSCSPKAAETGDLKAPESAQDGAKCFHEHFPQLGSALRRRPVLDYSEGSEIEGYAVDIFAQQNDRLS